MKILKESRKRVPSDTRALQQAVSEIIDRVCQEGDEALKYYNQKFDQCQREALRIDKEEIKSAYQQLSAQEIEDMKTALSNIRAFAQAQRKTMAELEDFNPMPGIHLGHRILPVQSCCCYVPGGGYPLYSTALMLAAPAKVAGVPRITACSPVVKGSGQIHPKTLVAMNLAGVDEIYAVGGAQAVAAFSYGTQQIAPVDLIVGPGNQYVTEAKRQCYGQVGIDFVAGPSEVLVLADAGANPEVTAADLLAQSEHDPNAKGILITTDEAFGHAVIAAVEKQLETLKTARIARQSWNAFGEVLLADSISEAVDLANTYAPEHLELTIDNPQEVIPLLHNYGSLFIGENTAEVFGDYASGTNHTLPTLRASRYTGGVWVGTFLKTCTHQSMTAEASRGIAPLVARLAEGEGLAGHAKAAKIRERL
ncbi:MAG: histidinol dehydrogenase [Lachnospiraceae bacterium]|nr:histidinol dehydrogenase [Lachnospiraceae bacterium]